MVFLSEIMEHADVWQIVVLGGEDSDEVTMRRAIVLFNMMMTMNDNRFQMMNSGYLDFHDTGLRQVLTFPFYEIWRESPGAGARSPEFLDYVDDIRQHTTIR